MLIASDSIILDLKGQPVPGGPGGEAAPPLTVKDCCIAALLHLFTDETLNTDEKVRRFKIATRLSRGGDVALSAEEVATLKACVGKFWNPLVVGRVFEALDPEPEQVS